jgi:hypothetical protein
LLGNFGRTGQRGRGVEDGLQFVKQGARAFIAKGVKPGDHLSIVTASSSPNPARRERASFQPVLHASGLFTFRVISRFDGQVNIRQNTREHPPHLTIKPGIRVDRVAAYGARNCRGTLREAVQ